MARRRAVHGWPRAARRDLPDVRSARVVWLLRRLAEHVLAKGCVRAVRSKDGVRGARARWIASPRSREPPSTTRAPCATRPRASISSRRRSAFAARRTGRRATASAATSSIFAACKLSDRVAAAASFHGGRFLVEPDAPAVIEAEVQCPIYIGVAEIDRRHTPETTRRSSMRSPRPRVRIASSSTRRLAGWCVPDVPVFDAEAQKSTGRSSSRSSASTSESQVWSCARTSKRLPPRSRRRHGLARSHAPCARASSRAQ